MTINALWRLLKPTWVAKFLHREGDMKLAMDLVRGFGVRPTVAGRTVAHGLLESRLLVGAYPNEGRRWLQPASDAAIATTGTNGVNFNVMDYFLIDGVGFCWTVAGTVTAMSMNFNLHPQLAGAGTAIAEKLDGTNGFVTSPSVGSQLVGNWLYKDLSQSPVRVEPGQSVRGLVATTTTAGNGIPMVVGYPIAEDFRNRSVMVASL